MNNRQLSLGQTLMIGLLAFIMSACSFPNKPVTMAAGEASEPLSDGEILQVLHVIHQGEIEQAELALQRSQAPQVQQVAQMILADHRMADQQLDTMRQTIGVRLEESPLSEGVQLQAAEIREELASLSGREFDRTYLQKQVELHDVALDTVRSQLLPNADSPQVEQMLNQALPKLEMHRQEAQSALGQIGG